MREIVPFHQLNNLNDFHGESGVYSFQKDGIRLDFALIARRYLKNLFIFFESTWRFRTDNAWTDKFPGFCLFVRDPALHMDECPGAGWYLGNKENDATALIAEIARSIASGCGIALENIVTWGKGEEGFAAIRLACMFENANACVINPLTDLGKYQDGKFYHYIAKCHSVKLPEDIPAAAKDNFSVIQNLQTFKGRILAANSPDATPEYREYAKDLENNAKSMADRIKFIDYPPEIGCGINWEKGALLPEAIKHLRLNLDRGQVERIYCRQIYLIYNRAGEISKDKIVFCPSGRSDLPPCDLNLPFDWNANPFQDNNWQAQLQMWRFLDAYILKYEETREPAWLAPLVEAIQDWFKYYLANEPGKFVWSDMMVGMRAMKLAWILALHYSGQLRFGPYFISICEKLRDSHARFLMDKKNIFYSNHTYMDMHGLMALAKVMPIEERERAENFATSILDELLERQFDQDGVHFENSPGYQAFSISRLSGLYNTGWFGAGKLPQLIEKAKKILDLMYMPDGRLAPVGDTDWNKEADPEKTEPSPSNPRLANYGGYVMIRADRGGSKSYLFFMGAFNSKIHKHSDDLSMVWYEDCEILSDPGKYAYDKSPERDYVVSTRAHNTVEIDSTNTYDSGDGNKFLKYGSHIAKAYEQDGIFCIVGEMRLEKFEASHQRIVLFKPGNFLICIDRLKSKISHEYKINWHFAPAIHNISHNEDGDRIYLPTGKILFLNIYSSSQTDNQLITGQIEPYIQGFVSRGYKDIQPAFCMESITRGKSFTTLAAFSFDDDFNVDIKWEEYISFMHNGKKYYICLISKKPGLHTGNNENNHCSHVILNI